MELYGKYFDAGAAALPYKTEREYWSDLLAVLDMRLAVLIAWRAQEDASVLLPWQSYRELLISPEKAVAFLGQGRMLDPEKEGQGGYPAAKEISRGETHILGRLSKTPGRGKAFILRNLYKTLGLTKLEQFLFLTALAVKLDARYSGLYAEIQGEGKTLPTPQLAFALYEITNTVPEEERARLGERRGPLFQYLVDPERNDGVSYSQMFQVSERLWAFLGGDRQLPASLGRIVSLRAKDEDIGPLLVREGQVARVKSFIEGYGGSPLGDCRVLHLYGEAGIGRHYAVQKGAAMAGKSVLFVEVTPLYGSGRSLEGLVRKLKLEQLLADAVLCFVETGITEDEEEWGEDRRHVEFPRELDELLKILSQELGFFIWMSLERASYLTRYPLHFMAIEFPMFSIGERLMLWKAFGAGFPLAEDVELPILANQYILTAKGIRETLLRADMMRAGLGEAAIGKELLRDSVRQQSVNQLGRYATLINAVFTWDDLVIDEEQKRQMQMICSQVRYRSVVGEEWGFHKKTPYGRGICALLYGSPGTGKTMAVQVMANELGLDLYRIDLSQMVSKYIGETEKNISALFRKARNLNAVLFFDEADSMFAKRSEVKDSNDRNANAETAHLLQKLEDYSGITFLATNYVNNIDDAFKRRIKFMIHFVFPEEEVRLMLWKRILPPQAQLDEELDLEFFARNFELAGSNIKEVLTNAAYIAASEHRGMANRDVVEAIRLNFGKYGKVLTMDDFGYLGKSMGR